tara:strand:- start:4324 stop:4788 length:465 start_codon:yes stop_codon:yes gene_type:complete
MTVTTFADFASAQEAREENAQTILNYTQCLCEALVRNYVEYSIRGLKRSALLAGDQREVCYYNQRIEEVLQETPDVDFYIKSGRKYHKIIQKDLKCGSGAESVHAFVDKKTGDVYKAASWNAPAKIVRFNLTSDKDREYLLEKADWAGGYLYVR